MWQCDRNEKISREFWINVRLSRHSEFYELKRKEVQTENHCRSKSSLNTISIAKWGIPALDTVAGVAVRRWQISNTSLMVGFRGMRSLLARVRTWERKQGVQECCLHSVSLDCHLLSWGMILFCSHSPFHLAIDMYIESLHIEKSHISPIHSHAGFNYTRAGLSFSLKGQIGL